MKKGSCITAEMKKDRIKNEYDYHKYWKDMYEKEHKLRQEAEGETTIVKGIGINSPEMKALKQKNQELKKEIDCKVCNNQGEIKDNEKNRFDIRYLHQFA